MSWKTNQFNILNQVHCSLYPVIYKKYNWYFYEIFCYWSLQLRPHIIPVSTYLNEKDFHLSPVWTDPARDCFWHAALGVNLWLIQLICIQRLYSYFIAFCRDTGTPRQQHLWTRRPCHFYWCIFLPNCLGSCCFPSLSTSIWNFPPLISFLVT